MLENKVVDGSARKSVARPLEKRHFFSVFSGLKRYIYIMKLSEIYNTKGVLLDSEHEIRVVKESMIPEKWKKDFNQFMFGQTCVMMDDGDFAYYFLDFLIWYNENKTRILRDEAIDDTLA